MDDLAHHVPFNHRKRKAPVDDPNDSGTADTAVADVVPPVGPSAAPRQPWLPSRSEWPPPPPQASSPLSSQVMFVSPSSNLTNKRPRLQKIETSSLRPVRRPIPRKSPTKVTLSRPPPIARHGSDIEDLGVVSMADPGPSSGSLLHLRTGQRQASPSSPSSSAPVTPVDINSAYIPSRHPLINRQTLKELDLDIILCNPQLRHDLLFDPGLQFRPTCSRKKRGLSEKYWTAIVQEIESGCTCVSFDVNGKPHPVVCVCAQVPNPPSHPVVAYSSTLTVFTLRMPSRISNLLTEFLEVLLLVIQPLSSVSGMYVNPSTFSSQMQEHSAQAAYIRSIFDPVLIEQELGHDLFDPSGLFVAVGDILKGHCAPMRDRAVELMVLTAQSCAPGGTGTKRDAVAAVRMCMELLELMKLDIANHQLQTLRPFLIRTSGQFELKAFRNRQGDHSLRMTREWLRLAHTDMLARGPILDQRYPSGSLDYRALPRNQQTYIAVIKGIVDLVFDPPPPSSPHSPSSSPTSPVTPVASTSSSRLPGYPETSYLDNARLVLLGADASDILALHMFLLLYRQLVYSSSQGKVQEADLEKIKNEICDISSTRLGSFFSSGRSPDGTPANAEKNTESRKNKQDIALQIAKRAKEALRRPQSSSSRPFDGVPDEQSINLAQRWADSNIRPDSALATMLRHRLRDAVFDFVVASTYPGRDKSGTTCNVPISNTADYLSPAAKPNSALQIPAGTVTTGMEPLAEEIRTLSEKISRVALIHLNAFLPLYEQDGFLD